MSIDTLNRLRAGQLAGITRLDLSCGLTALPDEVFALAGTLEVLNLSGNRLRDLPDLIVGSFRIIDRIVIEERIQIVHRYEPELELQMVA